LKNCTGQKDVVDGKKVEAFILNGSMILYTGRGTTGESVSVRPLS